MTQYADVIDFAWARPTPDQIKRAGYQGVIRYLSSVDSGKTIGKAELKTYLNAGLSVALVWENGARNAAGGWSQGVIDAQRANALADEVGWPRDCPIFYAVDFDVTNLAPVMNYLNGARAGGPRDVEVYGEYSVCEAAYAAGMRRPWQTMAWSGGRVSQHAVMVQVVGRVKLADTDVNHVYAQDWGQCPRPFKPAPNPGKAVIDVVRIYTVHGNPTLWVECGVGRRYISGTEFAAYKADGVPFVGIELPADDPFWKLPTVPGQ